MEKVEIKISGMSCNHCIMAIKKELSKIGAESFEVEIGSAKVVFDSTKIKTSDIENAVLEAGYKIIK